MEGKVRRKAPSQIGQRTSFSRRRIIDAENDAVCTMQRPCGLPFMPSFMLQNSSLAPRRSSYSFLANKFLIYYSVYIIIFIYLFVLRSRVFRVFWQVFGMNLDHQLAFFWYSLKILIQTHVCKYARVSRNSNYFNLVLKDLGLLHFIGLLIF